MNTPFTPGPWKARFSEAGGYDCMTSGWYVGGGDGMEPVVATIDLCSYGQKRCDFTFTSPRAEADARLLAAAPDLYAALKSVADWFAALDAEQYQRTVVGQTLESAAANWNLPSDVPSLDMAPIFAAVAKVEGRE